MCVAVGGWGLSTSAEETWDAATVRPAQGGGGHRGRGRDAPTACRRRPRPRQWWTRWWCWWWWATGVPGHFPWRPAVGRPLRAAARRVASGVARRLKLSRAGRCACLAVGVGAIAGARGTSRRTTCDARLDEWALCSGASRAIPPSARTRRHGVGATVGGAASPRMGAPVTRPRGQGVGRAAEAFAVRLVVDKTPMTGGRDAESWGCVR